MSNQAVTLQDMAALAYTAPISEADYDQLVSHLLELESERRQLYAVEAARKNELELKISQTKNLIAQAKWDKNINRLRLDFMKLMVYQDGIAVPKFALFNTGMPSCYFGIKIISHLFDRSPNNTDVFASSDEFLNLALNEVSKQDLIALASKQLNLFNYSAYLCLKTTFAGRIPQECKKKLSTLEKELNQEFDSTYVIAEPSAWYINIGSGTPNQGAPVASDFCLFLGRLGETYWLIDQFTNDAD